VDAANRLLADSGYAGEPVTLMAPREMPALNFAAVDDSLSRIVGSEVKLGGGSAECAGSIRWLRAAVHIRP
jgi:hypothetical protein